MKVNPFLNAVESLKNSGKQDNSGQFGQELKSIMGAMESVSKARSPSMDSPAENATDLSKEDSSSVSDVQKTLLSEEPTEKSSESDAQAKTKENDSLLAVKEENAGYIGRDLKGNEKDQSALVQPIEPGAADKALEGVNEASSTVEQGPIDSTQPAQTIAGIATSQALRSSPGLIAGSLSKTELSKVGPGSTGIKKPLTPMPEGFQRFEPGLSTHSDTLEVIDSSRSFTGALQAAKNLGKGPAVIDSGSKEAEIDIQPLSTKGLTTTKGSELTEVQRSEQARLIEKIEAALKQVDSKVGFNGTTKFVLPNGSEMSLKSDSNGQSMSISIVLASKVAEFSGAEIYAQMSKVAESSGITLNSLDFNGQRFEQREQSGSGAGHNQQQQQGEKRPSNEDTSEGLNTMNTNVPALNPKNGVSHFA